MSDEPTICEGDKLLLIAGVALTSATIPIYAFVLGIIHTERHHCRFERTFYAIVEVGGFSDIISLCGNLSYILTILGWNFIPPTRGYAQILNGIAWSSRMSTNLTDFLISLHRVTAVLTPLRHHNLWTTRSVRVILSILVVLSVGAFISGSVIDSHWMKGAGSARYIQYHNISEHQITTMLMQFIVASAILVNYIFLIVTYRRETEKLLVLNPITTSAQSIERNHTHRVFTKVAISVCSLEILFLAYSAIAITPVIRLETNVCIFVFLTTIIVGSPLYSLLYFSSKLRKRIVQRVTRFRQIRIEVVWVTPSKSLVMMKNYVL